jgi:hypothetical protein
MSVSHLTDFSDRISPMLVKELRQGLRAKTFVIVFLALQIFLAVMLFSAGAASGSDHVGSVVSGIIFSFFAIAVLVVQPLRGVGALSSEVKGNTIDMMVLTRLSAWRIVFGKWVAIVSQSALLLATIIPYLILRYFFGGMNLVAELVFLILLFLTSIALTAVTVGLSGCSSVIVRALLPVLGLPVLLWTLLVMSFSGAMRGSGLFDFLTLDNADSRIGVAAYLTAIIYLGGSMLSLGASLIAPAAENHALLRRLVAFVAMLGLLALGIFSSINEGLLITLVFVIAAPAIAIALTESAPLVSTVCKPFVKRGALGKAVGFFLYPCWPSGILYAITLGLLGICAFFVNTMTGNGGPDTDEAIILLSFFGALYFPALWQAFLFRGDGQRVAHYLLLLVGSLIMLGILTALSSSMDNGIFLWFFAWHPLAFIAMLNEKPASEEVLLAAVCVVDLVLIVALLIRAFIDFRKSAAVFQETQAALDTPD